MPEWKDVSEEIAQHLEDRYNELCAAGLSAEEAHRAVRAEIDDEAFTHNVTQVGGDLRFGFRTLRRNPAFAAVVVLTLAVGIGANAAIFSVVNAVVLRPLPYRNADRLVVIWGNLQRPGLDELPGSAGEYVDYRDRARAFDQVAACDTDGFNLTGAGDPERLEGAIVTPTLFPLLGATAEIGRTFLDDEERPGREHAVVLSHRLWTRRFNADPTIVGRTITLDGTPESVVGVMPAEFQFPDASTEIWKPILLDAEAVSDNNRGSHGFTVLARMKAGVTLDQAQAGLNAVTATFKAEHPNNYRNGFSTMLRPLQDEIVGDTGRPLVLLLAAVGFVLLIACANVANLMLARAASRAKEIALRTALGASRGRLVQQLLTESVLVSLVGGAAGLLLALWGVRLLVAAAPDSIPRLDEVGVDGRVVAFTALLSLGTGLLFGLVPAIRASSAHLNEALKEGGRGGATAAHGRAGRWLVMSEVALSLVLLIGAGLLVHSFARLQTVEPGFNSSNLLSFRLSLPSSRYTTFAKGDAFFEDLFTSLQRTPGIAGVAATSALPFSGTGGSRSFYIEGRGINRPEDQPEEQLRFVTHGYFNTMKIPLLAGREFAGRDTLATPRVAVVNDAFARKHFSNRSSIGARVSFTKDDPVWYEIVGVVGDIKHRTLDGSDRPELYVPYRQPLFAGWTVRPMYVTVRSTADPMAATTVVRREIARLDPDQPISDVRTMDARIDRSLTARRFNMLLLAAFASFALMLAAVGIYGIIACSVTQRRHEFGVRLALGAQPSDVLRMVVAQGMTIATIGAAAGVVAALTVTRVMSSLLFGVSAVDPITFSVIPLVLLSVAFVACYVPARRATRVDPVVALRQE